jgi:hypothetical protein
MNNPTAYELPDDVVLSVRHVSKKFCRNLRRSMFYGMQDLSRNLLGLRPSGDLRPETLDHSPGVAETEDRGSSIPESNVYGPKSKVSLPCEVPGVSREKFPATNQEPSTTHNALVIKHQAPSTGFPTTTNQAPGTKHQELFSPSDSGLRFHPLRMRIMSSFVRGSIACVNVRRR